MRRLWTIFLCIISGLLLNGGLGAQELPSLSKASEITTGKLPDGITYYLVNNAAQLGFADFALVQPSRGEGAREDLVHLPNFQDRKPYHFLARNSVGYGERGYIQRTRGATVFRFQNVPVAAPAVCDSTLLLLFDLARSSQYEQALVVSGNIDVPAIQERIRILSMTLSKRTPVDFTSGYDWQSREEANVSVGKSPVGEIRLSYRSPRTDPEMMNTIQPVAARLLAEEFEMILSRRLRYAFRQAGIPLADFRFRYVGSDATAGDELFLMNVCTDASRMEDAVFTLAGVLSALDDFGTRPEEVAFARSVISSAAGRDSGNIPSTNTWYVDKCIASYLYGANLASRATLSSIFHGRRLDIGRETELLNRFISATLSPRRNLSMHFGSPVLPDGGQLETAFSKGWETKCTALPQLPTQADTLRLASPHRKVSLRTTSADSFSGGKLWTFSNGVNVLFKKTKLKGAFHYGFMVKGGWADVKDISGPESAFVQDVLGLENVAGMNGAYFADLLAMNGISFEPQVDLSDVRFTGSAPKGALSLVLKAMLSVANDSKPDGEAFNRYCAEKAILLERDKFSASGTKAVLDSTMCPDYKYATGSHPVLPKADFPKRVDDYLALRGSTVRNGLIVLVGDLDEALTLRLLCRGLGDLKNNRQRVVRPREAFPLRECWSTSYDHGSWRQSGLSVSLSALRPFSPESGTCLQLACTVLQNELVRALADKGVHCSVTGTADLIPAEKFSVYISCKACPPQSLPAGVVPATPARALEVVREVINRLAVKGTDPVTLYLSKTMLSNRYASSEANPAQFRDIILYRNSMGRDVFSGYKERIYAVGAEDIRLLFESLSKCQCEYVVQ